MTFARDLAARLTSHEAFFEDYSSLHLEAAASTVSREVLLDGKQLSDAALARLLYCANVFVQSADEEFRVLAQSIALNALLVNRPELRRESALRLLVDLGNFPAVTFNENPDDVKVRALFGRVANAVATEINAVDIGGERIALTDFQKEAWDALPAAHAIAISAPTSAGKSFIVIEHLCRAALKAESFRAVYVAPTRALLSEVHGKIQARLRAHEELRVSTIPTGGPAHEREIFILTQERLQVLLAVTSSPFDMIVVDEAQNLSDGSRGMILQECLDQVLSRSPNVRLLMLAPGAEGFDDVQFAIGSRKLELAESKLPSVVQNRILVSKSEDKEGLDLGLITFRGLQRMGRLRTARGFDLPATRLAAVALELGKQGGSLVYATGPADAEDVAQQISQDCKFRSDGPLNDLGEFIETHIHKRYGLANLVRRGVAFHYGKMPTLLREALEGAFKNGDLQYLTCTTTLFQGVNLPARNVFIDTPTRGMGAKLDPAALWNFAGRAGRMKADVVGNVFLVDYQDWPDKPMDRFVGFRIEPAFQKTVETHAEQILAALNGDMPKLSPRDEVAPRVRAAAGLLISRAAKGDLKEFLERSLRKIPPSTRGAVLDSASQASARIGLPPQILATNWTVNPFGLKRLHDHMVEKVEQEDWADLIPLNPHEGSKAENRYNAIFMRIQREVNGSSSAYGAVVASFAVKWMKGWPYPKLLAGQIGREERQISKKRQAYESELAANPRTRKRPPKPLNVNKVVRNTFDLIEDTIRFQYVQLGKAYVDVLNLVLREKNLLDRGIKVFDFPLALELGLATQSGWSFMELGLSRIAATALETQFPNSNLSVQEARQWLDDLNVESLTVSPIVQDELRRLKATSSLAA